MNLLKNNRGVALVMVLLIITVILILGVAVMGLGINNVKISTGERNYQSTYYIAESGINYTLDTINRNIVNIYSNSNNANGFFLNFESMITNFNNQPSLNNFEDSFGYEPKATISIEKIKNSNANSNNYRDYKISSKGIINNRSRIVEKPLRVTWIPKNTMTIPDTAVFVNNSINLSGGATIIGDAGTNSATPGSVQLNGGASISDKIYVGPGAGNDVINKPDWMELGSELENLSYIKTFEMPQFPIFPDVPTPPNENVYKSGTNYYVIYNGALRINNWAADNYTLDMTEDMQFSEIYIDSDYTLNINIGNSNRNIVVDRLKLPNGKINIIGTGKLTIYVNNNISVGAGSMINTFNEQGNFNKEDNSSQIKDHIKKLEIFYKGTSLKLSGNQKIYGSLYAKHAEITMTGGAGFRGNIISGGNKVNINGAANTTTQLFYAPNAAVNISGGGLIKGSIIANSYTASGGSIITLEDFDKEDLPPIPGKTTDETVPIEDIISTEPTREK